MSTGSYLLGVDVGGSHTVCLLADSAETILGRSVAGPGNISAVGIEATVREIVSAVKGAWLAAGLEARPAAAACLGVSGGDHPDHHRSLLAALTPLSIAEHFVITNDADIALAAGSPDGTGVVLIAGTGAIAWGRNAGGERARASGWGYILGDEGSAFDIGLSALRAVMRAHDGRGPATMLTPLILEHWHVQRPDDLRTVVYAGAGYPRPQIAALAPLVEQAARAGDTAACSIYSAAAHELALAARAVLTKLMMQEQAPAVVLSGGIYHAGDLIIEPLRASIGELAPQARIVRQTDEPAMGAIHMAARDLGAHG